MILIIPKHFNSVKYCELS